MERVFTRAVRPLDGVAVVPGDKSLSHRAVLFSAMAEGVSRLSGVLDSADVRSTIEAVSALGARVALDPDADGSLSGEVEGWGAGGPSAPASSIDCGNSGTTARLLMGVLAGWPMSATLVGDASLSKRPMKRVTEPLSRMGACFDLSEGGTLPVTVHGISALRPFAYDSPVASAQVKTALLLAGLRASGGVRLTEPAASRDHTERLLPAYGISLAVDHASNAVSLCGPQSLRAHDLAVPRDPSSAAFLVSAALLVTGSNVTLPGVSLNATRTGFLRVLARMGSDVVLSDEREEGSEPVGTITARASSRLVSTTVTAEEVPSLVDEVPVLALVASQAVGTTRFEGVGELRVKESDRLSAVADGLSALGVTVREGEDWLEVDGRTSLQGATLDSLGDHRLAMSWALAGLIASAPVAVRRYEAVDVSFPRFAEALAELGA